MGAKGCVSLFLHTDQVCRKPVVTKITFSIINKDEQKTRPTSFNHTYRRGEMGMGISGFITHSSLLLFKGSSLDLLPDDTLTILCEINITGGHRIRTRQPFNGSLEKDAIIKTESLTRLSDDMFSIATMINKYCDLELVCGGRKFPCHKII